MRPDHEVYSAISLNPNLQSGPITLRVSGMPVAQARKVIMDFLEQYRSANWIMVGDLCMARTPQPSVESATDTRSEPSWEASVAQINRAFR